MMRKVCVASTAILAMGVLTSPATAQQAREPLTIRAENLMIGNAMHQEHQQRGGAETDVFPGDMVRYELVFTNVTDIPVRAIEFVDPIPAGLNYVVGSATADREDVVIEYSVDHGASYSNEPMVEVVVEGRRVSVPAPADRYTHVRWRVEGWVQPSDQVTAALNVELQAPAESIGQN